ncbi:MAG: DUF4435 domain-containing protein [Methanomethylophilus sp.]|jgi:hypothetical protein
MRDMRDDVTASDIANEICMMRSVFGGTFLVVEGVTDSRLYSKFTDKDHVRIVIAHSKDNVRRSVAECMTRRADSRVVGITDADMDRLLNRKRDPPVFMTDRNDMEATVMCSEALDDVLAEYGDPEKIKNFENKHGKVRDAIARAAGPVCLLMYISYRRGMNLSFKDLDHSKFVNPKTLENDIPRMVSTVYAQSMGQMYPKNAIADQVRSLQKSLGDDLWQAVRGHDAVAVLSMALRDNFGSYNAKRLYSGELGGALRLAYGPSYFKDTDLYKNSLKWCGDRKIDLWEPDKKDQAS